MDLYMAVHFKSSGAKRSSSHFSHWKISPTIEKPIGYFNLTNNKKISFTTGILNLVIKCETDLSKRSALIEKEIALCWKACIQYFMKIKSN